MFGATLARLRAERGLTQAALARRIGRKQSTIARLETGQGKYKYGPNGTTLCLLALALEVDVKVLTDALCVDMQQPAA